MTIRERLAGLDLRRLPVSLLQACLAIAALMLLTDRLQRVAKSTTAERSWTAAMGQELRLIGLEEGPFLTVEGPEGGGFTARADRGAIIEGGLPQQLLWMAQGDGEGDNKARVEIGLVGRGGEVVLSRSGEMETPQIGIRANNAGLRVNVGVTIGDSLNLPVTRAVFGGRDLPPTGPGFSFTVPAGETLALEFPNTPNEQWSGIRSMLGSVRPGRQDSVLPLQEVEIVQEDTMKADKSACAADRLYAWAPFFRPVVFPLPTGEDCRGGGLTARNLKISDEAVSVSLAGRAWEMKDGMPTASLWSWASANPVLSLLINKLLPGAVGLALGLVTWRRSSGGEEKPERRWRWKLRSATGSRSRRGRAQ